MLEMFEDAGKLHKYLRTCILGYSRLVFKILLITIALANTYLQFLCCIFSLSSKQFKFKIW